MVRILAPDLVLGADGAEHGQAVMLDGERIVGVGPLDAAERAGGAVEPLPHRALAPGCLNEHSHAFQRALRGRVERIDPAHPHDDFWTWREAMYALADSLDPERLTALAAACYRELRAAGYTRVVEFHYLHHQPDGTPYADPNRLALAVVEAAEATGLRLLLVPVAYARGGRPRFRDPSAAAYLERLDRLRERLTGRARVEVGVGVHSVRAVPPDWLRAVAAYAARMGLPLHVHADEQPREVAECLAEHGVRPIRLLADTGCLGPRTTVVHATHADAAELDLLAASGATVCACPTTEGNLGDGFLPARAILDRGIALRIGSDSHVRIDPFEELREIETNARRQAGRRNVLVAPGDRSPAAWLLRAAWGRPGLSPGAPADLIEIDLDHRALAGVAPEDLPAALVFGCGADVVAATWVGGERWPTER